MMREWLIAGLFAATMLNGCSSLNPGSRQQPDVPKAIPEQTEPVVAADAAPFAVSNSKAVGTCVQFELTNTGPAELLVSPKDFALIDRGARQPRPYNPKTDILEIGARVAPGETIQGRAMFQGHPNLRGCKLVFKPDDRATFGRID